LLLPEFDQFLPQPLAEEFGRFDQGFQRDFRVRAGLERANGLQKRGQTPVAEFLTFG
jgi:hypothetical protein